LRSTGVDSGVEADARRQELELMERELALLRSRLEHIGAKVASLKGPQRADPQPEGDH